MNKTCKTCKHCIKGSCTSPLFEIPLYCKGFDISEMSPFSIGHVYGGVPNKDKIDGWEVTSLVSMDGITITRRLASDLRWT